MIRMACLTPEKISDYLQGRIPEDQIETIEEHLSSCVSCESTVRQIDGASDPLIGHLRLSPDPPMTDQAWQSCLDSLRKLPHRVDQADTPPEPVSLEQALSPDSVYHYKLGQQLGRGGMGVVYQSYHPQLHRHVAIKILSAAKATDASSIARFQREMRAAGGLDHPGIVRALDAGVWQGTYYLVMEFIDGVDLSRLAHRSGPLDVSAACAMVVQAAEALNFAHEHQVIHRDIKPSNLILTRDGTVKILDFGLARLEQGGLTNHETTTAGRLVGTLDYLAPEQAAGKQPIDVRSDVYGLGATLFKLLTGRPPHGSSQNRPILQYLQELTSDEPFSAAKYRTDLDSPLCEIIAQMLSRDLDKRPPTAGHVAELLRPFADEARLADLATQFITANDGSLPDADHPLLESTCAANGASGVSQQSPAVPQGQPSRGNRFPGWPITAAALMFGLLGGWFAVTLWLKTGDALVQIESEIDDVSLQLIQNGVVAKQIEVHQGDKETRVRVGKYELRIAGQSDHVRLDQNGLLLMRGDRRIVRITREPTTEEKRPATVGSDPVVSANALKAYLAQSQEKVDSLRKKLAENHPAVIEASREHQLAKQEIMRIAFGEDPNAKTSKGRTYRQWSDIVLRETDPTTVAEGVAALASLSETETHSQTFATLMQIGKWNESRGSKVVCDDYIRFFSKEESQETQAGSMRRPDRTRIEHDYRWIRIYPPAEEKWRAVVEAIVAAITVLPEEAVAESISEVIAGGDDSSKRILLIDATRNRDQSNQNRKDALVRKLCNRDQSAQVRAVANFIWLDQLKKPASEDQLAALSDESIPLSKAVLATLLKNEQYPFGSVMGTAAGALVLDEHSGVSSYLQPLALRSIDEGDAFRESEECKLLEECGKEIVRQWQTNGGSIIRLEGSELIEMLTAADLLNEQTRRQASLFLHSHLQKQLALREKAADLRRFDPSTMWVMFTVNAITAVDGKLPGELEQHRIKDGSSHAEHFASWVEAIRNGSSEAEDAAAIWLIQFPLESVEVLFDVAAGKIEVQNANRRLPAQRFGMYAGRPMNELRYLDYVSPSFAVAYAAGQLDNANVLLSLGGILEKYSRRGLSEFQLTIPLKTYAETLLEFATKSDLGDTTGLVLRSAQIGGADDAQIQKMALQRLLAKTEAAEGSKNEPTWKGSTNEMPWLLECLAMGKEIRVTAEQVAQLNERVIAASFMSLGNEVDGLERSIIALLKLYEQGIEPDDQIVLACLGVRLKTFRIRWSTENPGRSRQAINTNDGDWRIVSDGVPVNVLQQALKTIVVNPTADGEILMTLISKQKRLLQLGQRFENVGNEATNSLAAAIAAVQKEIDNAPAPE